MDKTTDSEDFDYLFIELHDFIDKKKSLKDTFYGTKIDGDYFLFEGSDSTSLMGGFI